MSLSHTLRFITNHPLNRHRKWRALFRFFKWQLVSRLAPGPSVFTFVNNSRLLMQQGLTGATGNYYTGLYEFEDMAFTLHMLRPDDLFVDVGANIGAYTILAGAVVGATTIAVEPIPAVFRHLQKNVALNGTSDRTDLHNVAAGRNNGTLRFTSAASTTNRVVSDELGTVGVIEVPVRTLDEIIGERQPSLLKIDVEGYEAEVLGGAQQTLAKPSVMAVITELVGHGRRYGADEGALHEQFLALGFRPFAYQPFERKLLSLEGKNQHSGNTIYVKDVEAVVNRVTTTPQFLVNGVRV